jgi:hypothetical protein
VVLNHWSQIGNQMSTQDHHLFEYMSVDKNDIKYNLITNKHTRCL